MRMTAEERSISERWRDCVLDANIWEESDDPVIKINELNDFDLNEEEKVGILSERLIKGRLSLLAKSPHTGSYALTKCKLSRMVK